MANQANRMTRDTSTAGSLERLRLRVSAMVNSPKAQADRRATIWRLDTDTDQAWNQVMDELAETDGLVVTKLEDGTAVLEWQPGDEGEDASSGEEAYIEEMVVKRVEETPPF